MNKTEKRTSTKKINAYFELKRKKKRRRKLVFLTLILIVSGIVFVFKASIFNVKEVTVTGNKMIKYDGVIDAKEIIGENIFLIDTNVIRDEVLKNPYLKTADVKRVGIDKLNIKVSEREMFYKYTDESLKTYILNDELYIMDIVDDAENFALVELRGVEIESTKIGTKLNSDEQVNNILMSIAKNVISKNEESIFTLVDVNKTSDISVYKDNIQIVLGTLDDIDKKYEKAMAVLTSKDLSFSSGYIDVSVIEYPVVNIDDNNNQEE